MSLADRRSANQAAWSAATDHEVIAFLGPNSGAFRHAWERGREKAAEKGNGTVIGWSWPAFIFGFAWFAYRKQWLVAAVLVIVPLVVGYFLENRGALGGVAVAMAMFAKSFIVQDAVTKIAKIKAAGGGLDQIAAAGGVSIAGGVIGGILWLIALVGAVMTLVDA